MKPIATFSIVAHDPVRQEWGVAVQSKFLAVGAVVPWAKAGVGAVATQSYANITYGIDGLDMMAAGKTAVETIETLTAADELRERRQVGMVDAQGGSASFTGTGCQDWAGSITGDGFACQGNMLLPGTVEMMVALFEGARQGGGELAHWLITALAAGQEAGGDKRGRQSASLLVVREGGGYGGNNDRYIDLRVDDNPFPIRELARLLDLHRLYRGEVKPEDLLPLADVALPLQKVLMHTRHYFGTLDGIFNSETREALNTLVGIENLEDRWNGEGDVIDKAVVDFLIEKYP